MTRKRRPPARFLSASFVLSAAVAFSFIVVLSLAAGWSIGQMWPLVLVAAGLSGTISSLVSKGSLATGYLVSSVAFVSLGVFLAQFSFRMVPMGFTTFVVAWWPALLVAGFLCLAAAWIYSYYRREGSLKGILGASRPRIRTRRSQLPHSDRSGASPTVSRPEASSRRKSDPGKASDA